MYAVNEYMYFRFQGHFLKPRPNQLLVDWRH